MNRNKSLKSVETSTPIVVNGAISPTTRILKHAFPQSSDDDSSVDESYFKKRPSQLKKVFTRDATPGPSGKKRKTENSSSNNFETPKTKALNDLEKGFIEEMQKQLKTIIQNYPEIANVAEFRDSSRKSLAKHEKLAKQNVISVLKHQKNINQLQMQIKKESELLDQCLEAAEMQ